MNRIILVVEDHKETCAMIHAAMTDEGFKVTCVDTIKGGKDFLRHHKPDLIILDMGLPDGGGLEICALVRTSAKLSKTPIIALNGLTGFADKKRGFDAGADQYLEKTIAVEELSLWVQALLRRADWNAHGGTLPAFGDLQICRESYIVRFEGAVTGNLTRREFDLFCFLVRSGPKLISRKDIINEVWKTAAVENLVDTHICNLRKKLPPKLAARVQSVAGRGFRYLAPG